jgi:hypothetical protein
VIKVGTIGNDGAFAFSETHGVLVNRLIGLANLILVTFIIVERDSDSYRLTIFRGVVLVTAHAIVNRSKTHQIEKWQAEKWNPLFSACHFAV